MNPSYYILPGLKYPALVTSPHEETLERILTYHNVTMDQMKGKNRKRELVMARQICMAALHLCHRWTLDKTAKLFNRDHTTAIHSIQSVKNLAETDERYKEGLKLVCPSILTSIKDRKDYVLR